MKTSSDPRESTLRALADVAREEVMDMSFDEDDEEARALLAPPDAEFQARILARVQSEVDKSRRAAAVPKATAKATAPAAPLQRAASRARHPLAAMAGLALAAAIALFVIDRGRDDARRAELALPTYELAVVGGVTEQRGDPATELVLRAGSHITATLRPATRVEGPVDAHAALVRDGDRRPVALSVESTPEGALRMTGTLVELPFEPGPAELAVSIQRRDGAGEARVVRHRVRLVRP